MFWSLDEGCSINYGTRSVQKNVFTFGPDSQCALWLVPSSHSPLCSFFHLENDISKESRINSTYFLAQPLKACKQMLTTGAYSSLQNYGFILTFPSKSENINSCYISGFKSLFSTDLSLSARRAVTQVWCFILRFPAFQHFAILFAALCTTNLCCFLAIRSSIWTLFFT